MLSRFEDRAHLVLGQQAGSYVGDPGLAGDTGCGAGVVASSAPEVAKMTISSAPSKTCPIAAAPIAATTISRSTSSVFSRSAFSPDRPDSQPPAA
ncbi:hypothetical protein ABGB18_02080 [Nonomuraea sp. B12E4]|uniref:hypothetical protein n=1 Tax=Nonomuraea sp. B12E4 TaxID=3153564 RepID=UPI00325F3A3D